MFRRRQWPMQRRLTSMSVALAVALLAGVLSVVAGPTHPAHAGQTLSNTAPIAINDNAITPPTTASPYPSTIAASGFAGTITKAAVTLNGISHTFSDDIAVELVSPNGR